MSEALAPLAVAVDADEVAAIVELEPDDEGSIGCPKENTFT